MSRLTGILLLSCAVGCAGDQPMAVTSPALATPKQLEGLPLEFTVKQRSSELVPRTKEELTITTGDITRGQVPVTLLDKDGIAVFGPVSLKVDEPTTFRFHQTSYTIRVKELSNALIGDDFASFVIDAQGATLTEVEKIEKLIAGVEELEGATFIRNGVEHSAEDAAAHLRKKVAAAEGRVKTASQFIDVIASKSSLTGKEYQIRMPDGTVTTAREHLTQQLAKLEKPESSSK